MSISSSTYQSYGFSSSIAEGIEISYSYSVIDPVIDYLDQYYEYDNTDNDEDIKDFPYGFKAAFTQQILNNFPPWMEMRKDYDSNGNKLVNAWGMTLENVLDTYSTYRKDQFLGTANTYYDVNALITPLSSNRDRVYSPTFNNLLYNSSFSIPACAREQRPLGWRPIRSTLDAIKFDESDSIFGTHSVILDGTSGLSSLRQTKYLSLSEGQVTYSVFFKTEDNGEDTTELWDASEAGIILAVENLDSTVETYGIGFKKNTSGKWARAYFTVSLTKQTYRISAIIVNKTAFKIKVQCPLLDQSKVLRAWTSSINDVNPFVNNSIRTVMGIQVLFNSLDGNPVKKLELFPLNSEQSFKNTIVPTRIVPYYINGNSSNSFSITYGRHVNYFEEVMPTTWTVSSNGILESSLSSPDKFGLRYIADASIKDNGDLCLDASLINDSATQVKACCVYEDKLLVVTKEEYLGSTNYYLKFVDPKYLSYSDNYLPSYGDLKIPITIGNSFGLNSISEDILRIGICRNISNVIYIDTNLDRRFYFKLLFDYYYPDFITRKVFCRENYTTNFGLLQII